MIPIGVTARNESKNIIYFLKSLRLAICHAERFLDCKFLIHIILNDNEDETRDLLEDETDLNILETKGGLIEAQRAFAELYRDKAAFLIFSDADIELEKYSILQIAQVLFDNPSLQVAYCNKEPVLPYRKTILAKALYFYNLREGYQTERYYFNGQLFAIRNWDIPRATNLKWSQIQNNPFLDLEAGIRCDDIFLSKSILSQYGKDSIYFAQSKVFYRPPETWVGMFRKYQRMRLEIERLRVFFPETLKTHDTYERRRLDLKKLFRAGLFEFSLYCVFQMGLTLCKLVYRMQKIYFTYFSNKKCPTWMPILETKEPQAK